jgi:hypothetical protein
MAGCKGLWESEQLTAGLSVAARRQLGLPRRLADTTARDKEGRRGGRRWWRQRGWGRISLDLSPEDRTKLDEAMALAGRLLGATSPKWQRLEAICQEYVGAHPLEAEETEAERTPLWPGGPPMDQSLGYPVSDWLGPLEEHLEKEMNRWHFLEKVEAVAAPLLISPDSENGSVMPARVDAELQALAAMRDRWDDLVGHLATGECLGKVAQHFVDTWRDLPKGRITPEKRAVERDMGLCQVPGCSRAAVHAHHVLYRAWGGGDQLENLVALCAAHHLHGVHKGFVRVTGRAPGDLVWELGEKAPEMDAA